MMLSLLTKKIKFTAPVSGKLVPLAQVPDRMITQAHMQTGFAIEPRDNNVYSPIKGTVTSLFPTQHAIGLKTGELQVLVFMGIDTVELDGRPFTTLVQVGDSVTPATQLATMDRDQITAAGKQATTTVLVYNAEQLADFKLIATDEVTASTLVAKAAEA